MKQKIIITIERQCGSGGEKIGEALAERLNIVCFDREILTEAVRKTNIDENIVQSFDEVFVNAGIYSMVQDTRAAKTGMEYKQPLAEQVYLAEYNVTRDFAENRSGIFIGRYSDYVLQKYINAIHFFIHAPIDIRVERVCQYENLKRSDVEIIVRKRNKEREKILEGTSLLIFPLLQL